MDIDGILLKSVDTQYGDSIPKWAQYMRIVKDKDDVYHVVRPDVEEFLEFCFQWFEVWIWFHHEETSQAQCIMEICFLMYY